MLPNNGQSLKLEIDSQLSNTVMVAMAVRGLCNMTALTPIQVNRIELCLVEIVNNAVEHAYTNQPGHIVETVVHLSESAVSIVISDWGKSIPAEKLDVSSFEKEDRNSPETLHSSGRGIYIVKSLMDEVRYSSKEGKNSFLMVLNVHE